MSVKRSPPGSRAGSPFSGESLSGSNTDLPTNDYHKITHRRRKQIDADFVSSSQLTEFKTEIMEFFNNFGNSQRKEFKSLKDEVSQIKGVKDDVTIIREQLESIKISTVKITREHSEMMNDISELKNSLNYHSAEQTTLTTRIDDVVSEIKKVDLLQQNISELQEKYESLRNEYNFMQQRDRAMNIEISQIPEKKNEIVSDYVIAIGKYTGIVISAEDLIYAHRVKSRDSDNKSPKNIVVQLKSILLRDSIISAVRKKKGLTTIDIGIT
ncbi:unnamed protein product [Parnassius apollo]|uniref:(apollo) hypothetical protein n=1 Tax=Parnassius apollo TaxID=110799 RepID=A0A8S3XS50_PARAO|nr:unnamed protein product [Parnassius apollo]